MLRVGRGGKQIVAGVEDIRLCAESVVRCERILIHGYRYGSVLARSDDARLAEANEFNRGLFHFVLYVVRRIRSVQIYLHGLLARIRAAVVVHFDGNLELIAVCRHSHIRV